MKIFSKTKEHHIFGSQALGVDFSGSVLRILQIEKNKRGNNLMGFSEKNFSKEIFRESEIVDFEKFRNIFEAGLEDVRGKFSAKKAVVSIPESKVFMRVVQMPEINSDEAQEAIKWETESNIPMSMDEVYYDWQIIDSSDGKMNVLLTATPKKIIENYLLAMEKIGIEVVAFEPESIATGRSVIPWNNDRAVLVADVGFDGANFIIYKGLVPILTSSGAFGGKMFSDLISKSKNWTFERAENQKIKVGLLGDEIISKEEMAEILSPALSGLLDEIEKTIGFFSGNFEDDRNTEINEVVITGGSANLKGIEDYFSKKTNKLVFRSDPWVNLKIENINKLLSKERAQSFATTVGLAIRGQEYENYH